MNRGDRVVGTRQAVIGIALGILAALAIVAGIDALVARGERAPELEAPAGPEPSCPSAEELAPEPVPVTADELIECPDSFDGRLVTYTGEAVRAVLPRGERAWVQLNDDPYALELGPLPQHRTTVGGNSGVAVSIPAAVADRITFVGDYRHGGDLLRITGTFRRADPADGGGPAIEASSATIVREGSRVPHRTDPRRAAVAAAVAAAAALLGLLNLLGRR